jgi:hydroxymethylbilane synthase
MRGNVPTRVRKWKEGMFEAIVLARAGIDRLGLKVPYQILDPKVFVPAVGQGAIAIVCSENSPYLKHLETLNDPQTRMEVEAERFVLKELGGGCSVPIGVWARLEGSTLRLRGVVIGDEGRLTAEVAEEIPVKSLERGLAKVVKEMRKGMEGRKDART